MGIAVRQAKTASDCSRRRLKQDLKSPRVWIMGAPQSVFHLPAAGSVERLQAAMAGAARTRGGAHQERWHGSASTPIPLRSGGRKRGIQWSSATEYAADQNHRACSQHM